MKLFLLRHAKSAWRSFENDHDRALSERGLRDAKTLAEHISNSQISFSKILCSTAKRKQISNCFEQRHNNSSTSNPRLRENQKME